MVTMKQTKYASLLVAVLLIAIACVSCTTFAYDNQTVYAKVTAVNGQSVTLLVGELSAMEEGQRPDGAGGDPIPPNADGSAPQLPDGGEPADRPALPVDETMPNGELPQMPEGGMQQPNGEAPDGMAGGMQVPFTAGEDTITLTLNEETVKTLSVDCIVRITFGDHGSVESLTVLGGEPQGGFGGGDRIPPEDGDESGRIPNRDLESRRENEP